MRIFLDDIRDPPIFDHITGEPFIWNKVIRSAEELIELVKTGQVTFISFDHDLAGTKTGYDVAKEIEKLAQQKLIPPIGYMIHSGNVVGATNIDRAMKSAFRFWYEEAANVADCR